MLPIKIYLHNVAAVDAKSSDTSGHYDSNLEPLSVSERRSARLTTSTFLQTNHVVFYVAALVTSASAMRPLKVLFRNNLNRVDMCLVRVVMTTFEELFVVKDMFRHDVTFVL